MSPMNDAELRRRLEALAQMQPSPQATSQALERVRQTLMDPNRLHARESIGRIVMNSKWTKLAAAAVLVVAAAIGVHFIGGSTVTFATVIRPILNANTAILDHVIGAEDPNAPVIHDMVMGSRIRRTVSTVPNVVSVIDLQDGKILTLVEAKKEAIYTDLKGLKVPNYMDHLKNVIGMLQESPHFVVEELGVQQIDGRKLVGFTAKHPRAELTIWADAKTGLPVRLETKEGQMLAISKNLRFDEPMDEALFSMEVPTGYKLQQKTELDLNSATEADFVEGLRVMAELFGDGQFPEGVALEDFMKQLPALQTKGEKLKLSPEDDAALGKKIQQYVLFLRAFKGEGKWYYRGKGVKLGEADKPIFWYRPRDSKTYRVIYGDLHVADVAPENLPEPLAPDDGAKPSIGYQPWSKPDFVGAQEDLWRIGAAGQIVVQSEITLMKGPQGVSVMPITLPYATGVLTSVTLGDTPVVFQPAGPGQFSLQLPLDKLLAGQTKITCTWTLVLPDLAKDSQNVPLKSLIPVVYYELAVSVDPDSGWEYVKDPAQSTWVTFTRGTREPMTDFNVAGLGIRKRQ